MATSQVQHFLLPLLVLFSMLSAIQSGTWLSFNQNTGGIELADRLLSGRLGKSIADVVSSGELDPEKNVQLAGLLRMCRDRVKRSSSSAVQPNMENLNDLCSALLQLTKEQRRKRKVSSRFVPVRMDEDLLWW